MTLQVKDHGKLMEPYEARVLVLFRLGYGLRTRQDGVIRVPVLIAGTAARRLLSLVFHGRTDMTADGLPDGGVAVVGTTLVFALLYDAVIAAGSHPPVWFRRPEHENGMRFRWQQELVFLSFADVGSPLWDGDHQALVPEHLHRPARRSPRDAVVPDEV
jgi:hypothetical protein